jgi:hypothetical protein
MQASDGNKPVPQNCKMYINLQENQKYLKRGNINVWAYMDTPDMHAAHSTLMPGHMGTLDMKAANIIF